MIRTKKPSKRKRVIDLTGPEGNAFYLLGVAKSLSTQLKLEWRVIKAEMTSGDYENLIKTFDKYFGNYIDLER